MKLLHLADLHIGKQVNEFPLADDQRHILAQVLDLAITHNVDVIVVAGDVYDKGTPSAQAVALVDWFMQEVAAQGITLIITAGNHDSAERIAYGGSILAKQQVYVSPVYDGSIMHVTLEDEHGPVVFWLIPFLRPAMVRLHFPDKNIESYTDALACALSACEVDRSLRNVAVAHQFVTSCGNAPKRSDSETVSVGGIDEVDGSVFDAFDYVALGHIHGPQRIGNETMRYSGSPLKYSFSEHADKTVPLVTLQAKPAEDEVQVSVELLPLVPLHDMREIRGPLAVLTGSEVVKAAPADDYLHVTLTDENPPADALDVLRACYPNIMTLDFDNSRTRAAGTEGAAADLTSDKTPFEHFEDFYAMLNGQSLTENQARIVAAELDRVVGKGAM